MWHVRVWSQPPASVASTLLEGLGPTLGLSHASSTLLVGRRFPGSWKQNGPCQQSSAASSALQSGAGEGEVRQGPGPSGTCGEGGRRGPASSKEQSSAGAPACQSQLQDPSFEAHAQVLSVPLPPLAKDRVTVFPEGGASQERVQGKAKGGGRLACLEVAGAVVGSWSPSPCLAVARRVLHSSPG